ncbi:hypothetical protein DsansV1_C16g0140891 [Dioscorea sansibarensis]
MISRIQFIHTYIDTYISENIYPTVRHQASAFVYSNLFYLSAGSSFESSMQAFNRCFLLKKN